MQKKIFEDILNSIKRRCEFAIATVIGSKGSTPGKIGFKMIVYPDGKISGTVGGAGLEKQVIEKSIECIKNKTSGVFTFNLWYKSPGGLDSLCGGIEEVFIEYMDKKPHILICGGGHIGYAVSQLCDFLEYFYSVLDDRPEFSSKKRFPNAVKCYTQKPDTFFKSVDLKQFSHILIFGYSHYIDTEILKNVVGRFDGYIGIIGSKSKKKEHFERLKKAGIKEEYLKRVECPLGLPIGAKTPQEIAVSIIAGVIKDVQSRKL